MSTPPPPTPRRSPAASMALITDLMERPLDPGYAAEAERRRAAGLRPSAGTHTPVVVVAALLIGFLLVTAALSLRVPATAASKAKAQLIGEIQSRRAAGDQHAARIADLRSQIDQLQGAALAGRSQQALARRLSAAEFAAGTVPARGPGLRLTIDDAASDAGAADGDANPRTSTGDDSGRVLSRDVQYLVNSLWQAGAEAISINGQRLTAQSAIRFAGQAILVDYRPLTRPYVITAIGDPDAMPRAFQNGDGGAYLTTLEQQFHIRGDLAVEQNLQVPGSSSVGTRLATPAPTPSEDRS